MKQLFWVIAIVCVLAISSMLHKVVASYDEFLDKLYTQTAKNAYILGCIQSKGKRTECVTKAAEYVKGLDHIKKINE